MRHNNILFRNSSRLLGFRPFAQLVTHQKSLLMICLGLCFMTFIISSESAEDRPIPDRPNVIVIYTDDQGSIDLNAYGATDLITPHMDSLAKDGIRFTQFYSAAPVCSPSRAAMLTGKTPQKAGVPGNVSSMKGVPGMPTEQVLMPEIFKKAGYRTAHIGKWHLGFTPQTMPNGQGFDHSFGHMGGCIDNYSHFFYWNGPNRHDLWRNGQEIWEDGQYFPKRMTEEARSFMEKKQDQPFFMYWAINLPHYPMQGTSKWREIYRDLPEPRRHYAAFISTMDEMIGELLGAVDDLGLRENTIVVFQSDHGHSTEVRGYAGGGSSGGLRGAKFSLFEGGIRVPSMIRWPGKIPAGEVRDQFSVSVDWYPTLAELCGIELDQKELELDGESLVEVLKTDSACSPHKSFHWQSGGGNDSPQWAVRDGNWKLIGNAIDTSAAGGWERPGDYFLINLDDDPFEKSNVANDHPERLKSMISMHDQWIDSLK